MDAPNVKHCSGCGRDLPPEAFAKDKNRRDGLQPRCRECVAEYGAAYYRRRREAMGKKVWEKVDLPEGHKLCRTCGEIKPHSEFHRPRTAWPAGASRAGRSKGGPGISSATTTSPKPSATR